MPFPRRGPLCTALLCAGLIAAARGTLPALPQQETRPEPPAGTARDWWSLRPLRSPPVPRADPARVRSPVDAFVLRRLRAAGLQPSPEADRATLIRRLTYDLHGLPPTPAEIDAFAADPRMDAYERLVDRLLASPRYGERWARHWLDVAHYGETHGYDKDKLRPHAWPYRDYVIRALNRDTPYPRFVAEQLAGDVLFPGEPDGVIATGFIAAGPWDFVGHVELREGTVDKKITRSLDRDDMVRNAMSTFASTTAHCARCHDHKFDPIPQVDYYRLQAVFAGVERADRPIPDPAVARERETLGRGLRSAEDRLAAIRREVERRAADRADPELAAIDAGLAQARAELDAAPATVAGSRSRTLGYHCSIMPAPDHEKWVQVDLGRSRALDGILLVPAHVKYGGHPGPGFGFPPRFRVSVSDDPTFAEQTVLGDFTAADHPHPGDTPVAIPGGSGRHVRVTATKLWKRTGDYVFALGELVALAQGRNLAAGAPVTAKDSIEAVPGWSRRHLTDGHSSRGRLAPAAQLARLHRAALQRARLAERRRAVLDAGLPAGLRRERRQLAEATIPDLRRRLAALPQPALVYAAASAFPRQGNFHPPAAPRRIHVLKRGDVGQAGEEVTAGALSAVPDLAHHFAGVTREGERRAALARWLTDPANPLTWRSIVNRVFQYHFGQGLSRTPNDFGRMGDEPSHPELLDWLATWFRDGGGSLKQLHRLLLCSATYRQVATDTPEGRARDAGNRLLWRMNRRRLEAECVRDGVLAVSGRLDLTAGGPSARHFGFKDDHSPHYDYGSFDVDSPASRRRGVYRLIVRSVADPFMERLDCPDASLSTPVRYATITAPQALALLNNRFMVRHAEHFAARLEREAATTRARIGLAFPLALGRRPRSGEVAALVQLAEAHGLPAACRTLLNCNEFLFID